MSLHPRRGCDRRRARARRDGGGPGTRARAGRGHAATAVCARGAGQRRRGGGGRRHRAGRGRGPDNDDTGGVAARLQAWEDSGFARRLWAKDHTLWSPTPLPELTDRLGWLDLPSAMTDQTAAMTDFAYALKAAGIRHIVLLGMGGSSLAPEVFQRTFGNAAGYPALIVLDSTHPGAVAAVDAAIDPRTTVFLVSSKSGTTTETLSLFRYFWRRVAQGSSTPGAHFVAITDPDTPLVRAGARARVPAGVSRAAGRRRALLGPDRVWTRARRVDRRRRPPGARPGPPHGGGRAVPASPAAITRG